MARYVRIESGTVIETLDTNEDITTLFPPELIWVNVTEQPEVGQGWVASEESGYWRFSEPRPPTATPAEILAINTATRDQYLAIAALRIAPLQDAVDIDVATEEEAALLKKWKQYRVSVNRVDLTLINPAWPSETA